MKRLLTIAIAAAALMACGTVQQAAAREPNCKGAWSCQCEKCQKSWNAGYYHTAWGTPVALVVPPTAELQTKWGWGVGNTRVTPICPQFKRNYPGDGVYNRAGFRPTPNWPSDTDQFGVYYIRGPW
jgi:hypothetical protein